MMAPNPPRFACLGILTISLLLLQPESTCAQSLIKPGDAAIDSRYIQPGTYDMGFYSVVDGQQAEVGLFTIKIHTANNKLSVYTRLQMGAEDVSLDTSIADGTTFKPIYRSSSNQTRDMVLHFNQGVSGHYYDKKTKKKHMVKEPGEVAFFDSYTYPYLLGLLPLVSGYKAALPVFEYKPENNDHKKKALIKEVKSNIYVSRQTGEHKVWQVSVYEEATQDEYSYLIDKGTRRLWQIEITTKGQHMFLVDKETDFNPFTEQFDKKATMKMVQSGNSVILGQVFARDNQNEGLLKGMAVLNINEKQVAKRGTSVILIPYTPYFKEWIKLNKVSRKKGISIPLAKEAAECIKVTTVYDNKGHFEFTNLMPGDYLLYTEFGYVHTSIRSEVTGYTDTYINGMFQGTTANTTTNAYNVNASATVQKIVTIEEDGVKLQVKLKKTL